MNSSDKLRLLADEAPTLLASVKVPAVFLLEVAKELEEKDSHTSEMSKFLDKVLGYVYNKK